LAGIILFLTVTSSFVLGILAAYGAVAGIIYLFARKSGQAAPAASQPLVPEKAMSATASGD